MPHSLSAKKRLRQNERKLTANRSRKREVHTRSKSFVAAVTAGEFDRAQELLDLVVSKIDRASKRHVFHRNKAARMKSRLAAMLNTARSKATTD